MKITTIIIVVLVIFIFLLVGVLGITLLGAGAMYSNIEQLQADLNTQSYTIELLQSTQQDYLGLKSFKETYCDDFNNTTDTSEVRELATNYLIAQRKNAQDILFSDIYLVGNNCNAYWWIAIDYSEKTSDNHSYYGHAFLSIDAVTKDLKQIIVSYGDYCSTQWSLNGILGETKHEASKTIPFPQQN